MQFACTSIQPVGDGQSPLHQRCAQIVKCKTIFTGLLLHVYQLYISEKVMVEQIPDTQEIIIIT